MRKINVGQGIVAGNHTGHAGEALPNPNEFSAIVVGQIQASQRLVLNECFLQMPDRLGVTNGAVGQVQVHHGCVGFEHFPNVPRTAGTDCVGPKVQALQCLVGAL